MLEFTFGGTSSASLGIQIATRVGPPSFRRRVHMIPVPGRKRSVWIDEKVYDDGALEIPCGIVCKTKGELQARIGTILGWVDRKEGVLAANWLPEAYEAIISRTPDFQLVAGRAATFNLSFVCRPNAGCEDA